MRIEIGESADLKIFWIVERPPELLASAIEDCKAVRIVHRWPKIVDLNSVVRSEEKHACHGRKPDMRKVHPRIDSHFHVEDGGVAGPYREAIGCRRALAVQQCMHRSEEHTSELQSRQYLV